MTASKSSSGVPESELNGIEEKARLDELEDMLEEMLEETGGALTAAEATEADRILGASCAHEPEDWR